MGKRKHPEDFLENYQERVTNVCKADKQEESYGTQSVKWRKRKRAVVNVSDIWRSVLLAVAPMFWWCGFTCVYITLNDLMR